MTNMVMLVTAVQHYQRSGSLHIDVLPCVSTQRGYLSFTSLLPDSEDSMQLGLSTLHVAKFSVLWL